MGIYTIATGLVLLLASCHSYPNMGLSNMDLLGKSVGDCTSNGYHCTDDCKNVQLCVNSKLYDYKKCNSQSYCDYVSHDCIDNESRCSPPNIIPFTCCGVGLFPDLFNCSVHYLCDSGENPLETIVCEKGSIYDVATSRCKKGDASTCSTTGPNCLKTTTGALEKNPNLYYVCNLVDNRMYPQVCSCPSGYYDPSKFSCVAHLPSPIPFLEN
uniref:Chitin-binding type-2 domain-containing protein n=1 Tax=Timema tahoe TaxID=61484 RepID=A0A7R9IRS3_9NEOP|nr:unnamed protein product [Timema tahoe]